MARDLRTRLAGIRSSASPRTTQGSTRPSLPGWARMDQNFWMRELSNPFPPVELGQQLDAAPFSSRLNGVRLSLSGMRFLDLETTGLSGGTGTVAFLATLGRFSSCDRFTTVQYFMDDYPGEPSLVRRLAADLSEATTVVTYNGGSFDLPLFRTRCIMNGFRPPEPPRHLDLLVAARRLWRGVLPDCSLGTVERSILSIDRGPDIPGSAIPERWFSFIRGGRDTEAAMEVVFSHNDSDVRTLATLLVTLAKGFEDGRVPEADPVGLALVIGRSNPALALDTLETALAMGELRAIKPLMRTYWKAGRREDRMALIPLLPDDSHGLYMKSIRAEKVDKDMAAAVVLAGQALAQAEGSMAKRIELRLKRLGRGQEVRETLSQLGRSLDTDKETWPGS